MEKLYFNGDIITMEGPDDAAEAVLVVVRHIISIVHIGQSHTVGNYHMHRYVQNCDRMFCRYLIQQITMRMGLFC